MAKSSTKSGFPLLHDFGTRQRYPLADGKSFLVGRSREADLPLFDRSCSRQQFVIRPDGSDWYLEPLSGRVQTMHNEVPITAATLLEHGSVIAAGSTRFCFLEHEDDDLIERSATAAIDSGMTQLPDRVEHRGSQTLVAETFAQPERMEIRDAVPVQGNMLIGRDRNRADIHLAHAHVSRVHARVTRHDDSTVLTDLNSSNGTYVNGQRISGSVTLQPGDLIDIGPYSLGFDGLQIVPRSRADNVELIGRGLRRVVTDRRTGKPLTLLDDVNLVVQPREFLCIIGPSGSGKSTLLSALSARVPADEGKVTINGEDLYVSFEALKQDIAVVPQHDVLHDRLTLQDALTCTARLRLPLDTTNEELGVRLDEMLDIVGLSECAGTRVRDLSGGQLKRASLANEIISEPSLVFLDEATSGLDEQTDAEMMRLFRQLAVGGKTVVCTTHNLVNVEPNCHLLVVLADGGVLAFVGSPGEALEYFAIERLGDLYNKLAEQSPREWGSRFESHGLYARYIDDRMPVDDRELVLPAGRPRSTWRDWRRTAGHQFLLLNRRYLKVLVADRMALWITAGQCLLVSMLLCMLFGDITAGQDLKQARDADALMFLMSISCLWFGCNKSAKEIVRERAIYTRERDVNLQPIPYYLSKFCLLSVVSVMQTLVLFILVKQLTSLPGDSVAQLVGLLTLAIVGVSLGLAISTFARTEDVAVTIVPLVLIPNILLAGAFARLEGFTYFLARLGISSYWARQFLVVTLPENLESLLHDGDLSLVVPWAVLCLHAGLLIVVALGRLVIGGRRDLVGHKARQQWLRAARETIERGEQAIRRHIGDSWTPRPTNEPAPEDKPPDDDK